MISTIELSEKVVSKDLCVNCGACQGMCPYWTSYKGRTLSYFDCSRSDGRCIHFCPRMPLDIEGLRDGFFRKEDIIPELGPFKELYLARAADQTIRKNSQHGGCMTALLELALEEGFIDAAVVTKSDHTLDAEGMLAVTKEEIRSASGSSFQIPASLAVLNKTLKEDKYKKIGVVGTPCKTLAVYKMKEKTFACDDNHADNISMVFGLFCGWGLDWEGLAELTEKYIFDKDVRHVDIPPSKYHSLEFEGIEGKVTVDLDEIYPLVRESCKVCADLTAEFADISVGGARSSEGWEVDKGWNQIIVRSEKGLRLMEKAKEKGVLEFRQLPETAVDKLKAASTGKKRTALKNLADRAEKEGTGKLGYLEPSAGLFERFQ